MSLANIWTISARMSFSEKTAAKRMVGLACAKTRGTLPAAARATPDFNKSRRLMLVPIGPPSMLGMESFMLASSIARRARVSANVYPDGPSPQMTPHAASDTNDLWYIGSRRWMFVMWTSTTGSSDAFNASSRLTDVNE